MNLSGFLNLSQSVSALCPAANPPVIDGSLGEASQLISNVDFELAFFFFLQQLQLDIVLSTVHAGRRPFPTQRPRHRFLSTLH